jgi:hypothetical protein
MSTNQIDTSTPRPRRATVTGSPTLSIITAPKVKPEIDPTMAMLVSQPPAVALTLVGKSSVRIAPYDGVSIVAPSVARNTLAARNHPESRR